jgi:hypothetical protein
VELLDTRSGGILPVETEHSDGWSVIRYEFYPQGHLLVRLSPSSASAQSGISLIAAPGREVARLTEIAPVTLSEPNALLLDQAEWRNVNDETWQPLEEILRLDNLARPQMGLGARSGNIRSNPGPIPLRTKSLAPWLCAIGSSRRFRVEHPALALRI